MGPLITHIVESDLRKEVAQRWEAFLSSYSAFDLKIIYKEMNPIIVDDAGNKFQIDFENNKQDYQKFKKGPQSEILSRALGGLKLGRRVLDLSAGLGVDAIFLVQLGFSVGAVERNPIVYLALNEAHQNWNSNYKEQIQFYFGESLQFLNQNKNLNETYDICYFDPMFPNKRKTALPKQEMVFFKKLVGHDEDALSVLKTSLLSQKFKRVVVKRPLEANALEDSEIKRSGSIEGKIIRYDIYTN